MKLLLDYLNWTIKYNLPRVSDGELFIHHNDIFEHGNNPGMKLFLYKIEGCFSDLQILKAKHGLDFWCKYQAQIST